ncbi:MAG TPA: ComF family protein [Gemmatimonadales bacterium]
MTAVLVRSIERFLLPNVCIVCEQLMPPDAPDGLLCGVCATRLRALPAGGCARCAQPLPPVGPCRFCSEWPAAMAAAHSGVWLDEPARTVVHRFKYGGFHALGAALAHVVSRRVPWPSEGLVVPIPLGARRLRERGYNQSAILGRALADTWKRPMATHLLRRVRETATQTTLTPDARRANVDQAFAAGPGHGAQTIILIDDVLTTGATLGAAARALSDAGWGVVRAVTFARALPYDIAAST